MMKVGVIGVGELTEKIITGLMQQDGQRVVNLSPRNHERASDLAARYSCNIMESNQAVVDESDLIILGVRPQQLPGLAREITIAEDKQTLSLAAGVSRAELAEYFQHHNIQRMMTTYAAEINQTTIVFTSVPAEVESLFAILGRTLVVDSEREFELATVGMCMNGWMYFFSDRLQAWFIEQGMPAQQARKLVLGAMADSAAYGMHHSDKSLAELGRSIATEGTYTARGVDRLNSERFCSAWEHAAEDIFKRLNNKDG